MIAILSTVLGGIGLFLLGMVLMTDGLKTLAGDALRYGKPGLDNPHFVASGLD